MESSATFPLFLAGLRSRSRATEKPLFSSSALNEWSYHSFTFNLLHYSSDGTKLRAGGEKKKERKSNEADLSFPQHRYFLRQKITSEWLLVAQNLVSVRDIGEVGLSLVIHKFYVCNPLASCQASSHCQIISLWVVNFHTVHSEWMKMCFYLF